MSITVESTTDDNDAVMAATGNLAQKESVKDQEAVSQESDDENNTEDSDTSEEITDDQETVTDDDSEDSDEDDSDDSEEKEEDDDKKSKGKKRKGGYKRKIAKLQQEAEYWREQALKENQTGQEKEVEREIPKAEFSDKPNPDNFETVEDYYDALTDWKVDQRFKKQAEKEQLTKAQAEYQRAVQTHAERINEFKKTHSNFDEVVQEGFAGATISAGLEAAILESDLSAELVYELAQNPDEFDRLNSLPPVRMAKALGRMEARLEKSSSEKNEKPKIKTSKAPRPISAIKSKGNATSSAKNPDEMTYQEYKKWRESQRRA